CAVLYSCLAARPPFCAPPPLATLRQLTNDDPVPPRQLTPGVPRDLETFCLRCLRKDPARRYPTAWELAEDLRRFLAGEPIKARPVGRVERAARWARRHPAAAAAYGLRAALLGVGLGGGGATWVGVAAEKARGEAEDARNEAEAAKQRAETAEGNEKAARGELMQYAYADRVYLAQRAWDDGQAALARDLLRQAADFQEQMTPGQRSWEW